MSAVSLDKIVYVKTPRSSLKNHVEDRFVAFHKGDIFIGRDYGSDEFVLCEMYLQDTYGWFKNPVENGLVVDIGANIGAFSVPASKNNLVVAYEPEKNNLSYLRANRELNNSNIVIKEVAVGKPNTTSTISDHNGGSTLGTGTQPVIVAGLDEVIAYETDFLKMDCEGGEYDAFKYASDETIKKIKRFAMEVHKQLVTPEVHQELLDKLNKFFVCKEDLEHGRILGVRR